MKLKRLFSSAGHVASAGLHHFTGREGVPGKRLHLRVESDGRSVLLIDAAKVIHLNPTATDMIFLHLSGYPLERIVQRLRKHYRVDQATLTTDVTRTLETLTALVEDHDTCPITFLGLDRIEPFKAPISAPYRMDLALTYRCNIDCAHCYNEDRPLTELTTDQWKDAMLKIRDAGIPHVVFTGGEATLREDLPDLIGWAESLGLVSGLLTNGVRLADAAYLARLQDAGLDYVQITLESADPAVHNKMVGAESFNDTVKGLDNCLAAGIYTITNSTLTRDNVDEMEATVRFLADKGLRSFAVNSIIHSGKAEAGDFALDTDTLTRALIRIRELAEKYDLRLIWYSPTRYCHLDPMKLELGPKRCTAGQYNLCVEPDGTVLPCQSYYEGVGNILTDDWDAIYQHPLLVRLRNREWVPEECLGCEELDLCGGGCPLEAEGKPSSCPDIMSNG